MDLRFVLSQLKRMNGRTFLGMALLFVPTVFLGSTRTVVAVETYEFFSVHLELSALWLFLSGTLCALMMVVRGRIYWTEFERWTAIAVALGVMLSCISVLANGVSFEATYRVLSLFTPIVAALLIWGSTRSDESRDVLFLTVNLLLLFFYVAFAYWLLMLDPFDNPSHGLQYRRLGASLLSTLMFGYIAASSIALYLYFHQANYGKWWRGTMVLMAGLGLTILTGSRGAVLLALAVAVSWLFWRPTKTKLVSAATIGATIVVAFLFTPGHSVEVGRLGLLGDIARMESWSAAVQHFVATGSIKEVFVGYGWGTIYPYESWLAKGAMPWDNRFLLAARDSVITPHNSYLWVWMENGFVLFLVLCTIVLSFFTRILGSLRQRNGILVGLASLPLFALTLVTDVLVIHPHTALIIWFLLLGLVRLNRSP